MALPAAQAPQIPAAPLLVPTRGPHDDTATTNAINLASYLVEATGAYTRRLPAAPVAPEAPKPFVPVPLYGNGKAPKMTDEEAWSRLPTEWLDKMNSDALLVGNSSVSVALIAINTSMRDDQKALLAESRLQTKLIAQGQVDTGLTEGPALSQIQMLRLLNPQPGGKW
jgi:hypothetical protein